MIQVYWTRCSGGGWCELERVDVSAIQASGVHIVWHGGSSPRVIRVGEGNIAELIGTDRANGAILSYRQAGALHVTWAVVDRHLRTGVARFVANRTLPRVSEPPRVATAVPCNMPFALRSFNEGETDHAA